ncbi:MAG: subclass B1 metallo-beta-lactamase [Leadbetterella sp.]|nr:subclass B1 metallo-beta-lactamase [Leadbetterella sp.]
MKIITKAFLIIISIANWNCRSEKQETFQPKEVHRSENLVITQIAENSFEHTSFKQTNDFGNVPCNGLIVRNNKQVIVFDTPTNDPGAEELIQWIAESLQCKIMAVIPTHFHDDSIGGLKAFDNRGIPSYAYSKTVELAKENNYTVPRNSFSDSLVLKVGDSRIIARFFGEGHTRDNVVGYFPDDRILFGGCLIKESDASKGYLGDANESAWSATVEKVKAEFPDVSLVVPGHGEYGGKELLDYTINLFGASPKAAP